MTIRARAYRATHAPGHELNSVLPQFHEFVEAKAPHDAAAMQELSRKVHLPVAAVRGALSSFSDSKADPAAIRVCAGTSCMLAGGAEIARELSKHKKCNPVYCLGYCDRAPAAMTPGGRVAIEVSGEHFDDLAHDHHIPHPPPPSIRCEARHAVVTERIGQPQWTGDALPSYDGLAIALRMAPEQIVESVLTSGVRGRGGAAYPTGNKWKLAAKADGSPKFIIANGDEGDPGSFIDRELMERDPHAILEGMAIAAHAVGASRGFVFIRSEYPVSATVLTRAIEAATHAGLLGQNALGPGKPFDVEIIRGMGSYVCGEETALLAAIEGMRGETWPRPPYPVESGVFGKPSVVVNVETLSNVPWIMRKGAAAYAAMGSSDSKGTKALCLNHGFAKPGIVEIEFGMTLHDVINRLGGGGKHGELEAVLLGGPMGSIVTPDQWDVPVCFAGMARRGIILGHGGLVAIPRPADWSAILQHLLTFMRDESCGKCVPCRLGTVRAHEMARAGITRDSLPNLQRILALMKEASLCAFGRETPGPVKTILEKFGDRIFSEARP